MEGARCRPPFFPIAGLAKLPVANFVILSAAKRSKIIEFVSRGNFGLASCLKPDGGYERVLFHEFTDPAEVTLESGVFLLLKAKAKTLKSVAEPTTVDVPGTGPSPGPEPPVETGPEPEPEPPPGATQRTYRFSGLGHL
jgi:hypothetical protein